MTLGAREETDLSHATGGETERQLYYVRDGEKNKPGPASQNICHAEA